MNKIPSGVVHFFEPLSSRRRMVENILMDFFKGKGYEEIVTPSFSYETTISQGLFEPLKSRLFKFVDKTTSETLILRADITMQIMQAVLIGNFDMPVKVCYADNIYRDIKENSKSMREFKQVGTELIGIGDISADKEIVKLAIEALHKLGLSDILIRLSDTHIIEEILKQYNLDKNDEIKRLIEKKNFYLITEHFDLDKNFINELKQLMAISGYFVYNKPYEEIKDSTKNILSLCAVIAKTYPDVKIFLDMFYLEYPLYHRGIMFDIFCKDEKVAIGGRYGKITESFGKYIPATGFSINIDELVYFLDGEKDE